MKYNLIDSDGSGYLMEEYGRSFGSGSIFLFDSDGNDGPEELILYVVHAPWGLEAYKP